MIEKAAYAAFIFWGMKMVSDVDVQYFSHLNGLKLDNNCGDLIRLLDKCLVNGIPLTISQAVIDEQGDIHLTTSANHNCMLFQIIEISEFKPNEINGKYRIKGIPTATELILKAEHTGKLINTLGQVKLASLGYEIVFHDTGDVKRVYRAKNPDEAHPFIRIDESISSDTGAYNSTYSKYAMVGLISNMEHIDDYLDEKKLQLPVDKTNYAKNWSISGTGNDCIRGWSKWYWARYYNVNTTVGDHIVASNGQRPFALCGDLNAFYFFRSVKETDSNMLLSGCGLYNPTILNSIVPEWFLMTTLNVATISTNYSFASLSGGSPLVTSNVISQFFNLKLNSFEMTHIESTPIMPDYVSGKNDLYNGSSLAALEIPFFDKDKILRGSLKHIYYSGNNNTSFILPTPILSENSMYLWNNLYAPSYGMCGYYLYLGEL